MQIHFYESEKAYIKGCKILHDWESTSVALKNEVPEIHTTQMCMLSTTWLLRGYRIFVHQGDGVVYEIVLQTNKKNQVKSVRPGQNIYAMWASDVFR